MFSQNNNSYLRSLCLDGRNTILFLWAELRTNRAAFPETACKNQVT